MWFLRWIPYVIGHPQNPFFTHHLNAPVGVNLMWNAAQELPSLVMTPVTLLFGVVAAYNVLITLALTLSGVCAFVLLRRWCRGFLGPLIGSLVYELSPYMVGQALGHSNLVLAMAPPLLLLLLDTLVNRPERSAPWTGVWIGLLAAAQLLMSEELLATEVLAGLIVTAALVVLGPPVIRQSLPRILKAGGAALGVFVITAGFPLIEQFTGAERVSGAVQNADSFTTDLVNLISPTSTQWLAPASALERATHFGSGLTLEAGGYLGLPLIVLLVYVMLSHRRELVVRVAGASGLLLIVLSLGPVLRVSGHGVVRLPWSLVHRLPIFENILPDRLMVYVFLAAAVLLAVFIDRGLRTPARADRAGVLAASAIALTPLIPSPSFPASHAPVPRLFSHWSDARVPEGSDVLLAPFIRDGGSADPMLWQAVAGLRFRMPQGYFYIPGDHGSAMYGARSSTLSQVMEAVQERGVVVAVVGPVYRALLRDLRQRGIRAVIVGPMSNRALMVNTFTLLFGRAPQQLDGVQIWRLPAGVHG